MNYIMSRDNVKIKELYDILEKFTRAVLAENPENIVDFAAQYFRVLNSSPHKDTEKSPCMRCEDETATNLVRRLVTPTIEINDPVDSTGMGPLSAVHQSGSSTQKIGSEEAPSNQRRITKPCLHVCPKGDCVCNRIADQDDDAFSDEEQEPSQQTSRLELYWANRNKLGNLTSRRGSVAAESYDPEQEETNEPTIYPKSTEQRQRLQTAFKEILIFRSLDEEQRTKVLDAMREMPVKAGQTVIQQGDDGDNFYVIERGTFDIFVNESPAGSYKGTGSFGELALMYNTPRAATIICSEDGVLWAVDRSTFRRIVLRQAFEKRMHYEKLLHSVPLLNNLSAYERTNVADALVRRVYEDGEWIVKEGERGDEMYFIEDGSVKITTKNSLGEVIVLKMLNQNDYFGELALILHEPRHASAQAVGKTKLAVLDVSSFERLMGPCLEVMLREATQYRAQLLNILGEACLDTFPALARLTGSTSPESLA